MKEIKALIASLGLTVMAIRRNGRGHIFALLRTQKGNTVTATFPLTPSDRRSLLNQRATIKRRVKEVDDA